MSAVSDFRENFGQMINYTASTVYSIIPNPTIIKPFAAAYGLVTGTEFSGSGILRSLSAKWDETIINKAAAGTYGPPEIDRVAEAHESMLCSSNYHMSEGLSRREAQTRVLGLGS